MMGCAYLHNSTLLRRDFEVSLYFVPYFKAGGPHERIAASRPSADRWGPHALPGLDTRRSVGGGGTRA